jgi:hypothetical protein
MDHHEGRPILAVEHITGDLPWEDRYVEHDIVIIEHERGRPRERNRHHLRHHQ